MTIDQPLGVLFEQFGIEQLRAFALGAVEVGNAGSSQPEHPGQKGALFVEFIKTPCDGERHLLQQIFTVGKRTDGPGDVRADRSFRRQPVPRHSFTDFSFTVRAHGTSAAEDREMLAEKSRQFPGFPGLQCVDQCAERV